MRTAALMLAVVDLGSVHKSLLSQREVVIVGFGAYYTPVLIMVLFNAVS